MCGLTCLAMIVISGLSPQITVMTARPSRTKRKRENLSSCAKADVVTSITSLFENSHQGIGHLDTLEERKIVSDHNIFSVEKT